MSTEKLCYLSQFLPPSQVAITVVYRHQLEARVPIDAEKWCQVMEKERVIATRLGAALGRTAEHVNNVSGSE